MITLLMLLNLSFLISDEGLKDASFMGISDLSLKLFSSANFSELDFLLQLFSE